jgi:hypothetical protein
MSKYEEAKKAEAQKYEPEHETAVHGSFNERGAFLAGSDFGANYERERSAKLVEALKLVRDSIEHISDDQFIVMNRSGIERAIKTLASYESKDFILDQEKGEI